jgi:hypothetical protein
MVGTMVRQNYRDSNRIGIETMQMVETMIGQVDA